MAAQKVLSAAVRTSECFGAHHLADAVCRIGTEVLGCGHHALPTFGIGCGQDRSWWLSLVGAEILAENPERTNAQG